RALPARPYTAALPAHATDSDGSTRATPHQPTPFTYTTLFRSFSAANDTTVNEGTTHTYNYTISDPGQDTVTSVSTSCDSPHGTKEPKSARLDNTHRSIPYTVPDCTDTADLTANATDSDGATGE